MTESLLVKLFEHNNWANARLIRACAALGDEQLDARPQPASKWTIRDALVHLVASQQGYLSLLTQPPEARTPARPAFADLEEAARASGERLLELARSAASEPRRARLRTTDGYLVEPWVVLVQVVNHATDHRRQISGMFRALGLTPPALDGWTYGEATGALVPIST